MKRRQALRNLSLSLGGIVTMPIWTSCWNRETLPNHDLHLTQTQELFLEDFVETLIPATDTPGAKELGVQGFVQTMVYDCYDEEGQKDLVRIIEEIEKKSKELSGKSFSDNSPALRTDILNAVENDSKANPESLFKAYPILKELTIQGYLNSEYVMTHIHRYELIPGRFNGSFPVQKV